MLNKETASIRRKLYEMLNFVAIPTIKFIADDSHLYLQRMNRLFEIADYGDGSDRGS
ncbi:unnamed protein product [Anisakis simplex]|uniref:Ribosome-binding factor A n=1 Tax=Anisakis simplex TaxID=6269 RepID=A0A3P6P8H7_ANISI|nr:unnamed protein product [Anisakis simplex]